MDARVPEFMIGTFDWNLHGLHFAAPPPEGLLRRTALDHANPWIVLATVLEFAKQGDHGVAQVLTRYFHNHAVPALARTALLLTGDIASTSDVILIEQAMASDDPLTRMYACEGAAHTGQVRLIPEMLRAWNRADTTHDHEIIGYSIADLLEHEGGSLAQTASIFPIKDIEQKIKNNQIFRRAEAQMRILNEVEPEFPSRVRDCYQNVVEAVGDDGVFIWHGVVWSIGSFCDRLLRVANGQITASLYDYRHRFEAFTGVDCSAFFEFGVPNNLAISAIVEDFLDRISDLNFAPGRRYFFGHPVPD